MSSLATASKTSAERKPFIPASSSSCRSPCPALNALANHGYIPHTGRSIPFLELAQSIRKVYSLSLPLAFFLTLTGFILCGRFIFWAPSALPALKIFPGLTLDLHDLAKHGKIEHNASLVHADAASGEKYAPCAQDLLLSQDFFSHASASTQDSESKETDAFSVQDLARVRNSRNLSLVSPLSSFHHEITMGELSMIVLIFGLPRGDSTMQHIVPQLRLHQWLVEERLPEMWVAPDKRVGILDAAKLGRMITKEMDRIANDTRED